MRDFRVHAPRVIAGGFAVATHLPSKSFASIGLLGYGGLLSCVGIISRFGRQARLGERGDSGLTAYRRSEFATLDKMRLWYRTRLGRFITSPR